MVADKFELITRNLQEVTGVEQIKAVLAERDLKLYWGTATTGVPHLGYFVPLMKIADFLEAGCHVKILIADLHAYLDNMKTSWELISARTAFYEFIIREILNASGVPLDKLEFVRGTDFQLAREFTLDVYKVSALATTHDTQKAGAEVVKQVENPKISSLLYPILQSLDEVYLDVDAQFGGVDQRKIFMFAQEYLPKVGHAKRAHLMNFMIPGLTESGKMSSSEPASKIDFLESDDVVAKKISKAFCVDGKVEGNGLLAILRFIIFRKLERESRPFVVDRPEKYGGRVEYKSYDEVESAFSAKMLSSFDLKAAITLEINKIIAPVREAMQANLELYDKAYPQ